MGTLYLGNTSNESVKPKTIYAGDSNNLSATVKAIYMGDSNNKSVLVYRNSTLPSAYQKVEYIYNANGTEYINTGVKADSNTRINISINQVSTPGSLPTSTNYCMFGSTDNYGYVRRTGTGYNQTYLYYYWGNNFHQNSGGYTGKFDLDINRLNGATYKNDSLWFTSTATFTSSYDYLLFAYNNSGTVVISNLFKFYLYRFQAWQGKSMIRDMYPCYRKSDMEVGMYDLATGTFYTNDGTGIFYKGPDVND